MIFTNLFGSLKNKTPLILLFFSVNSFAIDFKNKSIKLPKSMLMVAKDKANLKGEFYQYKLEHKVFLQPELIPIQKHKNLNTPKKLLATLFFSYVKEDRSLFLSLFDEQAIKAIRSIPKEKFNEQMDVMKIITKPAINYAFKYKGGIVISWKDPLFRQARQIFLKQVKDDYIISSFKAEKNDDYFWNVNLYMAGAPFEISTPELIHSFKKIKNGQKQRLSFKLNREGDYIHLIKKNSKIINLSLRDNYEQKEAPVQDGNLKLKYVDVSLLGEHFKEQGENSLYYIESSYPMRSITDDDLKKAKEIVIVKE